MSTKELGNLAENLAARFLQDKGYEIIDKNYTRPWGEVDIIAKLPITNNPARRQGFGGPGKLLITNEKDDNNDDIMVTENVIIFVEVKANKGDFEGFAPEDRVDERKRDKIAKTALYFLENELGDTDIEWRIDVVAVTFDEKNKKAKIKHYENI